MAVHLSKMAATMIGTSFNHVVEAKISEGVFLCKKYTELKNQTLNKSAGTYSCYTQRTTPGVT